MIGAKFLAEVSRRLQLAKGDTGAAAVSPFGGVNVIFTGDFGQLKPVQATTLFSHECIERVLRIVSGNAKSLHAGVHVFSLRFALLNEFFLLAYVLLHLR